MSQSRPLKLLWIAAAVAAGVVVLLLVARMPAQAQAHDKNCSDFRNQKQAQRWFHKHHPHRDPANLDSDNDGKACEDLPCPCSHHRWKAPEPSVASLKQRAINKHCGSQSGRGAGWYNVRAHNVSCREARHVARHYWHTGDKHIEGWSCHEHQVGEELSHARCHRASPHRSQRVKFEFGA